MGGTRLIWTLTRRFNGTRCQRRYEADVTLIAGNAGRGRVLSWP